VDHEHELRRRLRNVLWWLGGAAAVAAVVAYLLLTPRQFDLPANPAVDRPAGPYTCEPAGHLIGVPPSDFDSEGYDDNVCFDDAQRRVVWSFFLAIGGLTCIVMAGRNAVRRRPLESKASS